MNTETTCATNELALADLRGADIIRIETLNSVYEFTVGDPAAHRGTVSGGSFGKRVVDAVIVCERLRLKVGTQARLFVAAGLRYGFTTTSIITGLTPIKITERDVTTRMVSDGSRRPG